jgi:hypothetical protein
MIDSPQGIGLDGTIVTALGPLGISAGSERCVTLRTLGRPLTVRGHRFHVEFEFQACRGRWRLHPHSRPKVETATGRAASAATLRSIARSLARSIPKWAREHGARLHRAGRFARRVNLEGLRREVETLAEQVSAGATSLAWAVDDEILAGVRGIEAADLRRAGIELNLIAARLLAFCERLDHASIPRGN